jgi:hypothetical protein
MVEWRDSEVVAVLVIYWVGRKALLRVALRVALMVELMAYAFVV